MTRTTLLSLLVAVSACKSEPTSRPATPPAPTAGSAGLAGSAGSAAAEDPWTKADKPKAPETPEARKARAEAALARVAGIKPKIAALRELAFKHDVKTGYQTPDEFRAYVKTELAKELPPDRTGDISAVLAHIGLLAKPIDLVETLEHALATQVGAYYDPPTDTFHVVMVPDNEMFLDIMSAHELVHGLQQHHFALDKLMKPGMYNNDDFSEDAATAVRFLVEGDATYSMLVYAIANATNKTKLDAQTAKVLRPEVESLAKLDMAGLRAQMAQQGAAFSTMDEDMKKSFEAIDTIPPAILVPMIGAYMKGALVGAVAFEHGGWAALDALYKKPPTSTEQVLHPATKLFPKREEPKKVTLAVPAGAIVTDVIGELMWWVYFDLWAKNSATEASEGWGGDRFTVIRRPDKRLVASIATVWDTPADAKQFLDAYTESLKARFPQGGTDTTAGVARPDGGKVFVRAKGNAVFIVDGADDAKAIDELVKTTKL